MAIKWKEAALVGTLAVGGGSIIAKYVPQAAEWIGKIPMLGDLTTQVGIDPVVWIGGIAVLIGYQYFVK